jgi:epsin
MSMMSRTRSSIAMGTPSFLELKKQASFFFKEKLKTARLALTDVTPLQLMTEEATDGESCGPNTQTLGSISKAAFEFEDYLAIVEVLHKRLAKFDKRNWRMAYNSLIVVEHLLTHGPESVSDEFQGDIDVISQMQTFQQIDEKG